MLMFFLSPVFAAADAVQLSESSKEMASAKTLNTVKRALKRATLPDTILSFMLGKTIMLAYYYNMLLIAVLAPAELQHDEAAVISALVSA
jgi:hypothetical protein